MALEEILAHKRREVAERMAATSLESLLAGAEPSTRDFTAALRAGRPGFLLEVKFASPSRGTIRAGGDLGPVLDAYGRHADAISVLTDARYFGGSLDRLAEVRRRVDQPLLCKDFILEPFQVAEARRAGADAILLILAAVDDEAWRRAAALADRLGMAVLTEVHDGVELARALALGATVIGINNRDLRTLRTDLGTTERLAPRIPPGTLVVSESGIASCHDVRRLRPHADAMLVGSALMQEDDLSRAVRALVYGHTKLCGLTDPAQARAALQAGATHGGLVFAPRSPRRLEADQAAAIRAAAPLSWVGVFADQPVDLVASLAAGLQLDAVQLHGEEPADQVRALRRLVPARCEIWKAVRAVPPLPTRTEWGADRLLLDAPSREGFGGTGTPFDWSLLEGYAERGEVILAGGLHPGNVEAAAALGTWGLDASSGLESAPGRKDPALMHAFMQARRRLPGRGGNPR